jgi:DNA ligase-1
MDPFSRLFWQLDATTKTNEKIAAVRSYLDLATPGDAAWAIHFLAGQRIKRLIPTKRLKQWACERAQLEPWLFDECYQRVGDLAETISLILPPPEYDLQVTLQALVETELLPLKNATAGQQREVIERLWNGLEQPAPICAGQVDHRRISCRHLTTIGAAGDREMVGPRGDHDRLADDG